ncbi:MAG: hypothetical protein ACRD4S_14785 [Candidatus Acidiferrales bacterium]
MSSGQMRGGGAVHVHVSRAPVARVSVTPSDVRANRNDISTGIVFANGTSLPLDELSTSMPGLGLDPHQFGASNDDLGVKAFIDPATQLRLATIERFRRNLQFGGAFIPFYGGYGYDESQDAVEEQPANPQQQQPQVIVIQVPAANQTAAPAASEQQAEEEPAREAPLPDVGQFTLVLHNGTQIQAVAFTRSNNKIVYITIDGFRHTVSASDLDTDATQRINQERGTPLQLSL